MNIKNCPICSEPTGSVASVIGAAKVYACRACGLQFLSPQLDDAALSALYQESYYKSWGIKGDVENQAVKRMKTATFALRLDLISRYKRAGNVLDVGCATGYFLEAARDRGFRPYGVELSPYSCALAQRKFGEANVYCGILEDAPFPAKSFDVINMSDLLEHVRDPRATLLAARRLLKDDGIVVVMTPDTGSLTCRLMGAAWTHYKLEHFFYFDRRSLTGLAGRSGFAADRFEAAKKYITPEYLRLQFSVYPHRLLSPLAALVYRVLPVPLRSARFPLVMGEMVAVLRPAPAQGAKP